ncbi:MAG: biotin/lipoyl-binding protein, partial [Candidatus Zixiibacteriota bacterium]
MNKVLSPVLVSLLFVMLAACSKETAEPAGSGFIEADDAIISAETSGRILSRFVEEGDSVARGDTLALIDPSRLQLELASAKAAREVARRALEAQRLQVQQATIREQYLAKENKRVTTLAAANSASQQQLDKIAFDYNEAVLAVKTARTAVARGEAELAKLDADIARIER